MTVDKYDIKDIKPETHQHHCDHHHTGCCEEHHSDDEHEEDNCDDLRQTCDFTKDILKYDTNDPKFTKIGDPNSKKMRMSESFLAAKARCSPQSFDNNFSTDTTSSCRLLSYANKVEKHGQGKFICKHEGCGITFSTRKDLRRHKLIHRIRKHVCPIEGCGRAFFEKSKLKRHMVVHTKKKEFACPVCGKKFGYKANVKTHMRTHTGERPFKCRVKGCNKTFAQASNRNAHEKTHFKTPEERKRLKENQSKAKLTRKRKASDCMTECSDDSKEVTVRRSGRLKNRFLEENTISGIPMDLLKTTFSKNEVEDSDVVKSLNRCLDFDDLVDDICNMSAVNGTTTKSKIIEEVKNNNLFSEPPQNILFNSFTSFASGIFQDNQQHSDLGLNLDAIDNEFIVFGNSPIAQDSRIGFSKALKTPSRLTSKDGSLEYGFQERSKLPDITTSFLSTAKMSLDP